MLCAEHLSNGLASSVRGMPICPNYYAYLECATQAIVAAVLYWLASKLDWYGGSLPHMAVYPMCTC